MYSVDSLLIILYMTIQPFIKQKPELVIHGHTSPMML